MTYEGLVQIFLLVCLAGLGVLAILCLILVIIGPRTSGRMLGINMIGTQVIAAIALVSVLRGEETFIDVGVVYALLNFLAVVCLTKIYIGIYEHRIRKIRAAKKQSGEGRSV